MIELPPLGDLDLDLWHALLDVADRMPADWTLIGGQMVLLHALEHGRTPLRVSEDIDLVVDARVRPPALARMLSSLGALGFSEAAISADEIAHRFERGRVAIDVLARTDWARERICAPSAPPRRWRSQEVPTPCCARAP